MIRIMLDFRLTELFIDLGIQSSQKQSVSNEAYRTYLGGRGLAAWQLGKVPTVNALDDHAPLIFSIGALTGSRIPASGRAAISAFSPLTNTVCSCSVGGGLAIKMKKAGIDLIRIQGRAKKPLVVKIDDGAVHFEEFLAPEDTLLSEIFSALRHSDYSVAATGRAAYQGCLYSSIMVDSTFASGRGGLGLVMGSKNLRALAIRGNAPIHVFDHKLEERSRRDIIRLFDASPAIMGRPGIKNYGTGTLVDLIASRRMMPTANFRRTYFDEYRAFAATRIHQDLSPRHYACQGCPIGCKQKARDEIPEYETLSHFGALNENADLASIIEANRICNQAGLDTITAAASIACLAEIKEEKYQGRALVNMVSRIAEAKDIGELLQLGSARLGRELGAPEASMSVKSMEMPAYDPRGAYGMALAYCTSTRGGCHLRAYPISHEILRKPVATDRFSFSGKARIIKIAEDLNAVIDSIGACKFAFFGASLEEYAKGFAAVTGLDYDTQDLLQIGDKIYCLERYINTLRGFRAEDDMLPDRFYTEAGTHGAGIEIPPLDKDAFIETLKRYYAIRGCAPDGTFSSERIREFAQC